MCTTGKQQTAPPASKPASPKRSRTTPPRSRKQLEDAQETMTQLALMQAHVLAHARKAAASEAAPAASNRDVPASRGSAEEPKFAAPDGREFADEKAYKQYMFENFYSFSDRCGETLVKKSGDIKGQSFDMSNLEDCEVQILDHTAQVLCDNLRNCKVYVGACATDIFLRDCTGCTFTTASKQLRIRDCSHCKLFVYSTTRPALETSHHMEFGVFNGAYPSQGVHFRRARLDVAPMNGIRCTTSTAVIRPSPSLTGRRCPTPTGQHGRFPSLNPQRSLRILCQRIQTHCGSPEVLAAVL